MVAANRRRHSGINEAPKECYVSPILTRIASTNSGESRKSFSARRSNIGRAALISRALSPYCRAARKVLTSPSSSSGKPRFEILQALTDGPGVTLHYRYALARDMLHELRERHARDLLAPGSRLG